jgi:hypothetical protein
VGPALRVWLAIIGILEDALTDGSLRPAGPDVDPAGLVTPGPSWRSAASARTRRPCRRTSTRPRSGLFDTAVATAAASVGLHVDLGRG